MATFCFRHFCFMPRLFPSSFPPVVTFPFLKFILQISDIFFIYNSYLQQAGHKYKLAFILLKDKTQSWFKLSQTLQWNPNQYCLIRYAHYAPSQMSARMLQTDHILSILHTFPLVPLLESSAFPFFFLNPFVFQFWSYLLSEVSLATHNKPKLPHPLRILCFTSFNVSFHLFTSLSFYSRPSWCVVWDCSSKWVLVIVKIIFLNLCWSYSSKSIIIILMSGILFQACIT